LTIALKETPPVAPHIGVGAPDAGSTALLRLILDTLDDNKAEETVVIDLRGKSALADEMVIASGRSNRHVGAIADKLVEEIKAGGHGKVVVEGLPHCDWVLIDAGDVIVHLFRPEVRAFYNLEKMWSAGRPTEGPLS
jgi:ribosome-associated protein